MALTPTVTRSETGTWDFTWSAGTTPYALWLDGEEIASGLTTESYEYTGADYQTTPPPIEVLESGDTAENETYPPLVTVQWRGLTNADGYEVQRWTGSAWTAAASVSEDGSGYYAWTSDALDDVTTHQYRVLALSVAGAEGTPLSFTVFLVRNPAPPAVSMEVDSTGDVVVSAA